MKLLALSALIILYCHVCKAQLGNLQNLQSKNGYKGIVLGSDISTLPTDKLSSLDDAKTTPDSIRRFDYKDTSLYKISDIIKLSAIVISTYKNKILNITLVYDKKDGYSILEIFERAFGLYTDRPNMFMDKYNWYSSKVKLAVNFENKGPFAYAIYTCNDLQSEVDQKMLKANKKAASDL